MSRMPLAAAAMLALAGAAHAAPGDGSAGGIIARAPLGARSQGMGGGYGALGGAPEAFLVNPAAAGLVESTAVVAAYDQGVEGVAWNGLAAVHPILPWLTAGAGFATLGAGTVETYDAVGGSYHADLEQDRLITAGGAAILGPFLAGGSLKYVNTTVLDTEHASSLLGDVGIALNLGDDASVHGVLSLAAGNLGTSFRYGSGDRVTDPPPTLWRLSGSAGGSLGEGRRGLVVAALDVPRATARPEARAGGEFGVKAGPVDVAVRAGARLRRDRGALTAGAGVAFRGLALDYAWQAGDEYFAGTHHVSIGFDLATFRRRPPAGELP